MSLTRIDGNVGGYHFEGKVDLKNDDFWVWLMRANKEAANKAGTDTRAVVNFEPDNSED